MNDKILEGRGYIGYVKTAGWFCGWNDNTALFDGGMERGRELKREEDQIKRLKISIQKQPKTFL